jgi:hypothetical protein
LYRVVVPSLNRHGTIAGDTLAALDRAGVPPERIIVLAAAGDRDPEVVERYRAACPGIEVLGIPVGFVALNRVIAELWAHEWVVRIDDDVRKIVTTTPDDTKLNGLGLTEVTHLDGRFREACAWADAEHVTLWGVSPVANPLFMGGQRRTGLLFADGTLSGYRPHPDLVPTRSAKEDYERTLRHYVRDGAVGRITDLAFRSRPLRGWPGGMQTEHTDRRGAEREATRYLLTTWPYLVREKPARDGYPEVALRPQPRRPS